MKLADAYGPGKLGLSFELFPPKTDEGERALFAHVERLMELRPQFITCTYGAGGSTQDRTLALICEVKRRFDIPVASHLTCVGSTVDQLRTYLQAARSGGVDGIVALRGDPPRGESQFTAIAGGLRYANELVSFIRAEFDAFDIAVAGYPEKHVEAADLTSDLDHLANKVACGADIIITQLFYDNDDFWRFRDQCRSRGITAPIVPGLLPVTNLAQIQRITSMCGAKLPADFVAALGKKDDPDWQLNVGIDFATRQAQELVHQGADGLHFYVLNKSEATTMVLRNVSR